MPRTITTVINDLIRTAGVLRDLHASWEIPVEREGWNCSISVSLWIPPHDKTEVHVSIHGHGFINGDEQFRHGFYSGLSGSAKPARLTRKWVDQVLAREIETARLAVLSFTEADLRLPGWSFSEEFDLEEYRQEKQYFESTLTK